jgi:hypothetical protein
MRNVSQAAWATFWSFLTIVAAVPSVALSGERSTRDNLIAFVIVIILGFLACRAMGRSPRQSAPQ